MIELLSKIKEIPSSHSHKNLKEKYKKIYYNVASNKNNGAHETLTFALFDRKSTFFEHLRSPFC